MTRASTSKRRPGFSDPRKTSGFLAQYYPTADGQPAPSCHATDRNDRIKLRFLAAYYRLNRRYAQWLELKKHQATDPARWKLEERLALHRIEAALQDRDALEDQYAPYGVIAEPVMKTEFIVDVKFSFGNLRALAEREARTFCSSAYISIPLPPGVKLDQLKIPG